MGGRASEIEADLDHFDDQNEHGDNDDLEEEIVDVDELITAIHRAEWGDLKAGRRHYRSARRRVDDLAQERVLREELLDWYEDFGGAEDPGFQDEY